MKNKMIYFVIGEKICYNKVCLIELHYIKGLLYNYIQIAAMIVAVYDHRRVSVIFQRRYNLMYSKQTKLMLLLIYFLLIFQHSNHFYKDLLTLVFFITKNQDYMSFPLNNSNINMIFFPHLHLYEQINFGNFYRLLYQIFCRRWQ